MNHLDLFTFLKCIIQLFRTTLAMLESPWRALGIEGCLELKHVWDLFMYRIYSYMGYMGIEVCLGFIYGGASQKFGPPPLYTLVMITY